MRINLVQMQRELPETASEKLRFRLADTSTLVDMTLKQISEFSMDLRPAMLDDLGLVTTIQWYLDRCTERTGIPMTLTTQGLAHRLATELEITFFRIVQEGITNIIKHAEAHSVSLSLIQCEEQVELVIRDDGNGFDPDDITIRSGHRGMGLVGIRERTLLLHGKYTIDSTPGQGTRLFVTLPMELSLLHP